MLSMSFTGRFWRQHPGSELFAASLGGLFIGSEELAAFPCQHLRTVHTRAEVHLTTMYDLLYARMMDFGKLFSLLTYGSHTNGAAICLQQCW